MVNKATTSFENQFITLAGDIAESVAFNRSIGHLYGYLYICPEPRSLEEIAKACSMSKGNASIHLRILEEWGAINHSSKPGTRKDFYAANTNIEELAIRRLYDGLDKRIQTVRRKLGTIRIDANITTDLWENRLTEIENLLKRLEKTLTLLPRLRQFFLS